MRRTNVKGTVKGTGTIDTNLRANFEREVINYSKDLNRFLSGNKQVLFGSEIKAEMPKTNLNDIQEKYINLGIENLIKKGVRKIRAKSVSKYVFSTLLENTLKDIELNRF